MASRGPGCHREERASAYLDREHHRILHYTLQCPGFGATSRVWQRMQASVELPLDHSAEECLRNSEYSLSPRLILVFGCPAAYGQGAGVAEDPTGNSRCIMGARVKAAVATDASQGMMSHQQGVETRSAVERIAAFAAAARPERLTTDIRQLFKRNILDSLGCAIRVAALIEEARLRSAA